MKQRSIEEYVFREYDLYPIRVAPHRNVFRITTDWGEFALKFTQMPGHFIEGIFHTVQYLHNRGFTHLCPIIPNKFGDVVVPGNEGCYYLSPWVSGKHEILEEQWEEEVVGLMATMHHLTGSEESVYMDEEWLKGIAFRWKSKMKRMKYCYQVARSREYPSPFDVVFATNFTSLWEIGKKAHRILLNWSKGRKVKLKKCFTHGHIHQNNMIYTSEGKWVWIDLHHCRMDSPIRDMKSFYRHHLSAYDWKFEIGESWQEIYQDYHPLEKEEWILLYLLLLFPEPVISLIDRYYMKNCQWSEIKSVTKLEREIHSIYQSDTFLTGKLYTMGDLEPLTD